MNFVKPELKGVLKCIKAATDIISGSYNSYFVFHILIPQGLRDTVFSL